MAQDDPNAPAIDKAALRVPGEDDYYAIRTIPTPENVLIEGGGVAVLPMVRWQWQPVGEMFG